MSTPDRLASARRLSITTGYDVQVWLDVFDLLDAAPAYLRDRLLALVVEGTPLYHPWAMANGLVRALREPVEPLALSAMAGERRLRDTLAGQLYAVRLLGFVAWQGLVRALRLDRLVGWLVAHGHRR